MKKILVSELCLLAVLTVANSFAQKKIAILGSSTAAGYGTSVIDSSWVARLQASFRKNETDGIDTVIDNRAAAGYVTYQSLPTGYSTPSDRPAPDPLRNVTYILNDFPRANVVIINYPTNDIVNGYSPKEMMDNLRSMFQQFNANGIICFISTTQPRNTATDVQRTMLRLLVDSIQNNFGNYAINFWDDLVTNDGLNMLRPEVNADDTHPNDYGHRLLFEKVKEKNIFGSTAGAALPLLLKDWQAKLENNSVRLSWSTVHEELNTVFEVQRSGNAKDFETLYQKNSVGNDADYSWIDASPLNGKSFYRLKINETGKITYSRTISLFNNKQQVVASFYADASQLRVHLNGSRNQSGELTLMNYSGAILRKRSFTLISPNNGLIIPISGLPAGEYLFSVTTTDGSGTVKRFFKRK